MIVGALRYYNKSKQLLPKVIDEFWVTINDNILSKPTQHLDMLHNRVNNLWGFGSGIHCNKPTILGQLINHKKNGIFSSHMRQLKSMLMECHFLLGMGKSCNSRLFTVFILLQISHEAAKIFTSTFKPLTKEFTAYIVIGLEANITDNNSLSTLR